MSLPKLHELLAIEGSLKNQSDKVRTELANTFEKKRHLFGETRVTFTPNTEGAKPVTETQSDLQSTVNAELKALQPFLQKSLDASYQVAEANTVARADVVLEDGTTLLSNVPATALLELEKRIAELATFAASVPTLDPAKGFTSDPTHSKQDVFKAREVNKTRTRKEKVVLVKYEATKEHPAQVEMVDKDVPVGTLSEQEWSGLITPADKSELIDRIETVGRAVRSARSRANTVEVDTSKRIGSKLLDFIFNK